MSQPPQMPYSRPAQPTYGYSGGAYPPQGPPSQQDPGRYYSPVPQGMHTLSYRIDIQLTQ